MLSTQTSVAPARSSSRAGNSLSNKSLSENSLSVELKITGSTCFLLTEGELTGTSVVALEVQIDQLCCTAFDSVVLDLARLRAIDRVGCNVLSGLYHYVEARGATLRVEGASGQVARALAITPLVDAGLLQNGFSEAGLSDGGLAGGSWWSGGGSGPAWAAGGGGLVAQGAKRPPLPGANRAQNEHHARPTVEPRR